MDQQNIIRLLQRLSEGTIGAEEKQSFYNWLDNLDGAEYEQLLLQYQSIIEKKEPRELPDAGLSQRIEQSLDSWEQQDNYKVVSTGTWKKYAAAAAVILFITIGGSIYLLNRKDAALPSSSLAHAKPYKNDVEPGSNKAVLTLADGSSVILDDSKDGAIARQGAIKIIKLHGKLSYTGASPAAEALDNSISTPHGGQFQVELSDGTRVWLNAGSTLHYPVAFTGKERKVEVAGEAYFEIAKDPLKPFTVTTGKTKVHVLGTHFNIMAYADEEEQETTLLEGSVRLVSGDIGKVLKPGQQSRLNSKGQINIIENVNLDKVLAWKNGLFLFENERLEGVMRQLSRWYDVDVVYNKKVTDLFYAEIPRNTRLSDALKALELTGKVRFEIEGREVIVMP